MHVKGVQLKPRKGSIGQGCVFTLVCHSVHGGRGLASQHASQVTRPGGSASGGRGSASREEGGLHPDGRGGLHPGRRGFASGGKGGSASRGEMGLHPWGLHPWVYISGGGLGRSPRSAYRGRESAWGGWADPPPRVPIHGTLRDTINKRVVRILLECILVLSLLLLCFVLAFQQEK